MNPQRTRACAPTRHLAVVSQGQQDLTSLASLTPRPSLADLAVRARTLDIGLDLDGVVYDFVDALRRYLTLTTGRAAHTMPDPTSWNFFSVDWGMSLEEYLAAFHAGVNAKFIFADGDPFPGVVDGTRRLLEAGHRIHVITDRGSFGRPGLAAELTADYLARHHVGYTSLTVSGDKTAVRTDAFLDDRPENYTSLCAAGVDAYLRAHAYNDHVPAPADRRMPDFTSFVDAILAA